MIDVRLNEYDW